MELKQNSFPNTVKRLVIVVSAFLVACAPAYQTRPTTTSPVFPPTAINADFEQTWSATIAWFAQNTVSIKTSDKSSGLFTAELNGPVLRNRTPVLDEKGKVQSRKLSPPVYADCGIHDGKEYEISKSEFNVHITKTATGSSLQIGTRFTNDGSGVGNHFFVCPSTGKWENDAAAYIKTNAETK